MEHFTAKGCESPKVSKHIPVSTVLETLFSADIIVEAKKKERANALKDVKRNCKEFGFTAGMLKGSLAEAQLELAKTKGAKSYLS